MTNPIEDFAAAEAHYFESLGLAVRTSFLDLPNPRLRTRILETGEGSPVLYLHGGGGCSAFWAPLLARVPRRAICIDRPGCGLTDGFSYRGVDVRAHAIDFLMAVLDKLELEKIPIVANSMGGLWALWFAAAHPERVTSLALFGCPAMLLDTSAPAPMRLLSVPGLNRLMFALEPPSPGQARRLFARMGHDPRIVSVEVANLMVALGRLPTYVTGFATLLERVLRVGGARISFSTDELEKIHQRVLFVWGDRDTFGAPEVGYRACRALSHGRIEIVEGGHLPWLDQPEVCAGHLRSFLES